MGDTIVQKVRMTPQGCRVTTSVRKMPGGELNEEIILQAEDLVESPLKLDLMEEDTGQWLITGT